MIKTINTTTIVAGLLFVCYVHAKPPKVDEIPLIQAKINKAYEYGYVDSAPIEMSKIEKKVIQAKQARENRDNKLFNKLVKEANIDLKIVKKRFEVNQLNRQLSKLQQQNFDNQQILDELKGQL